MYEKIKEIAKKQGIPICKIESDLNFSQGSICKWTKNFPSVDRVRLVADYLKVDINEIVR